MTVKRKKEPGFCYHSSPSLCCQRVKEASLRIMFLGKTNLPTDRETLYWMNVKAIPPTDEKNTQKNTLQLALQNKIKLFYRPENLPVQPESTKYVAV